MQFFLDSASPETIAKALASYPLDGVTTNPAIIARDLPEYMSVPELLHAIRRLTKDKLMFVQVTASDTDGMIRDALKLREFLDGRLSIKIPATPAGIAAMRRLSAEGIHLTATAVYTTMQAMLASNAGAVYAAPYIAHIDALSLDGALEAAAMASAFRLQARETQVLAASFRTAAQVDRVIKNGVTAVTVTAEMLAQLASHPGTESELASFDTKWASRFDKGIGDLLG